MLHLNYTLATLCIIAGGGFVALAGWTGNDLPYVLGMFLIIAGAVGGLAHDLRRNK